MEKYKSKDTHLVL